MYEDNNVECATVLRCGLWKTSDRPNVHKIFTRRFYNHGFKNFSFSIYYEPPQNSRRQKADMKDPQILAAIIEKVLDTATWRPGFVHPCL